MCHQTKTNPSLVGILPVDFPQFCGVLRRQAHPSGCTKGTRDCPPPPKRHFCASEALECDNIPRDEEHGHALSGIRVSPAHKVKLCAAALFS